MSGIEMFSGKIKHEKAAYHSACSSLHMICFFVLMSALPVVRCPALNTFFFNGISAVRHRFDAASVVAEINLF
ncbi:hypothetical protein [Thiocapsa sp. UBA6158]|jgi:hypothetical protein|uniref:hypothetical protein n=1 Tax=Thiocapsa sp. UBA6158 TaxID=1947692 RepID=UPI0025CBA48D|nr:hypothetical protein [Thiocapsa sp. UBA6158]